MTDDAPTSAHWPVSPGYNWRVYFDRFRGHDDDGTPQADIRGGWAPTRRAAKARAAAVIDG